MVRFRKGIINKQILLRRIADSAIDIYSAVAVLSRASYTIQKNFPSKDHETILARAYISEAISRVSIRNKEMKNFQIDNHKILISDAVFKDNHYFPCNILQL